MKITKAQLHQAQRNLFKFIRHAKKHQEQQAAYEAAISVAWVLADLNVITSCTYSRIGELLYAYRYPRLRRFED